MSLAGALRNFHGRNFAEDINNLNLALACRDAVGAGLKCSPPSILTGDPFRLEAERCILVLGINPGWPRSLARMEVDSKAAAENWAMGFDAYREHRATYFQPGDRRYNGRHFSRLGNAIATSFLPESYDSARVRAQRLFREHAAIFDLIPWWSTDTKSLCLRRVTLDLAPISAWQAVLEAFLVEKRPRVIVVASSGNPALAQLLLRCELNPAHEREMHYAYGRDGFVDAPIFMHQQLSAPRAPSHAAYGAAVADWKKRVQYSHRFP